MKEEHTPADAGDPLIRSLRDHLLPQGEKGQVSRKQVEEGQGKGLSKAS
jgi:hypothetical protein